MPFTPFGPARVTKLALNALVAFVNTLASKDELATETSARTSLGGQVTTLSGSLTAEATTRAAADSAEATARAAADTAEQQARVAADLALAARADTITTTLGSKADASALTAEATARASADTALDVRVTGNTTRITTVEGVAAAAQPKSFGIDENGQPYYDSAGAAAGQSAIFDPVQGALITGGTSPVVLETQSHASATYAPLASPAFTGTPTGITKAAVGLGSVDNTADSAKPVSTPQAVALAVKLDKWQPSTAYTAGQYVLNPSGQVVSALADFTSGTTYSASNWSAPASGGAGGALLAANNLSDVANAATARTNLGLGTAALLGALYPGRRVGIAGDSISAGTGATSTSVDYVAQASRVAGSARATITVNGGVAGERLDQIVTRIPAILATPIDHLHIQGGTNDAGQGRTLAQYQASMIQAVALARAAGVTVSIGLVPPRGTVYAGTATDTLTRLYNQWLRLWCPKQGIVLADTFTPLADPTTGLLLSACDSGDGTHPSDAGHLAMARAVGPALIARQTCAPWPVTAVSPLGLVSNPLMNGTTGWSDLGGTATVTRTTIAATPADGLPAGAWQSLRINNTAGGSSVNRQYAATLDATKYSAGDVLAVYGYLNHTDTTGASSAKLQVTNNNVAFAIPETALTVNNPGPILSLVTVPASPNTLRLGIVLSVAAGLDVTGYLGATDVFNLTTGGLLASV